MTTSQNLVSVDYTDKQFNVVMLSAIIGLLSNLLIGLILKQGSGSLILMSLWTSMTLFGLSLCFMGSEQIEEPNLRILNPKWFYSIFGISILTAGEFVVTLLIFISFLLAAVKGYDQYLFFAVMVNMIVLYTSTFYLIKSTKINWRSRI